MVNDKHAKALDFMVNMTFSGSYFGCAAETKQCCCLAQFLGEDIIPSDAKNSVKLHIVSTSSIGYYTIYGFAYC